MAEEDEGEVAEEEEAGMVPLSLVPVGRTVSPPSGWAGSPDSAARSFTVLSLSFHSRSLHFTVLLPLPTAFHRPSTVLSAGRRRRGTGAAAPQSPCRVGWMSHPARRGWLSCCARRRPRAGPMSTRSSPTPVRDPAHRRSRARLKRQHVGSEDGVDHLFGAATLKSGWCPSGGSDSNSSALMRPGRWRGGTGAYTGYHKYKDCDGMYHSFTPEVNALSELLVDRIRRMEGQVGPQHLSNTYRSAPLGSTARRRRRLARPRALRHASRVAGEPAGPQR